MRGLFLVFGFLPQFVFAVVGGSNLPTPVAISIVNIKMKNGMCTGTVIAPHVVLTASHCRDLFGAPEFVAQIDAGQTEPCDISKVIDTSLAPGAEPLLPMRVHTPDLLLLRLEKPLCNATPARIASVEIPLGETAFGAGHGRGNPKFGVATAFELRLIPASEASSAVEPMDDNYRDVLTIGERHHRYGLAVTMGSSFCYGDSGGPVYRVESEATVVYAVNSAVLPHAEKGTSVCDRAYLQLMTPVAPHSSWIQSQIRAWE